jgi:membrane protein YqaA with SNARE-associated domain
VYHSPLSVPREGKTTHLQSIATKLFAIFAALGGSGLLLMGVLGSFLFVPLATDVLMIAMTARNPELMLYYAAMASVGSVIGGLLLDAVFRTGGEEGLKRRIPPRRLEYVRRKVEKSGGWALGVAALMPPPFPFTPFVAAAAAFQFPRAKLLAIIAVTRMIRFSAEGALALWMASRMLQWAKSPILHAAVIFLFVISIAGSVFSVYRWLQRSRQVPAT